MNANSKPKTAQTLTHVQRAALVRIAGGGDAGIPISGKRTSGTIKPITANTLQDHKLVEFFPNEARDQTWARATPAGLAMIKVIPAPPRGERPLVPPGPAGTALRRAAKIPPLPPRRLTSSECRLVTALATHHLPAGKTPLALLDTRPAGQADLVASGFAKRSINGVAGSLVRKGLAILGGLPESKLSLTELGWDSWTALRVGGAAAPATAPEAEPAPSAPPAAPEPATAPLAIGSGHRDPEVRRPPVGTILRRKYKGETHSVSVTETGFRWKGEEYSSLSAIGKILTGYECNGWSWFGLKPATTGSRVSAAAALAELGNLVSAFILETPFEGKVPAGLVEALERLGHKPAAEALRGLPAGGWVGPARAPAKKAPAFGKHRKTTAAA